jgi:hypothetical protein
VSETLTFREVLDASIDDLHRTRGKVRAEKGRRFYEKKCGFLDLPKFIERRIIK